MYGIGYIKVSLNDVLRPFAGLGKPTIKLEFEDNAALADFLKDTKAQSQYSQYTDVTASEASPNTDTDAPTKVRNNGKLMPVDDSRTFPEPPAASALPPTKTPPPLPPAPTAKALAPHKGNWTLSDIVEHSRNVIGQQYVLFENTDDLKYNFAYRWYLDFNIVSNQEICILLRYNSYYDNELKQNIDININDLRNKEFWKNNAQSFELVKKLINVSPLLWQIIQIYKPLNDIEGYNYRFDYKDFNLQYWFDDDAEFYHQGFICRISIAKFVKLLENQIIKAFSEINLNNKDAIFETCYYIVLTNDIISYITGKIPSGLSFNNITPDYAEIKGESFKDDNFVAVKLPKATNEPPVVKFTPKKPKQKEPEIEFDNVTYITRGMPAIIMDVPQSSISSKTYLNDWWNFAERKYHYPDDIVTFVQIEDKDNGTHYSKYYQFFFKNRDKDFVLRNIRNKKNIILKDDFFIVTKLADIERIEDALLNDGNRHLVIIKPLIYDDGLGKPTIKLEFEDNGELMSLFDTEGISGFTVNDKPAAVFNCPESELDCQGFKPTYRRLSDYSHLIDAADGAKTLKGYGFEKSTLEELVNACRQYKQVERLAAHLKDPDKLQSAFNIWHWLHTNVKYNYDTPGQEEIRTPARTWADRERGVDCDCLAVFTACLLINMGYTPAFEIVAFNDSPTYSHIYVNLDGVAIDRVLPIFMARPQNITKTKIMEIPVYQLSGIGGCNLGQISRLRMQDFLDSDTARWYYDDAIVGMLLDDINRMIRSGLIKTKKDIVSYMRRSSDKLSANGYSDAAEKYHVLSDRINPNINSIIKGMQVYDGLSGVYSSTLAKIQSGTATGNDLNDFRKTQVLVTLKGIDEDAYKLAALLMPHIATIGDDGKYYFDNAKFAEIATKADAGLSLLKQQGASKEVLQNWLAEVVSDIDIADTTATASDEDTIVVVINPKGCPCRVAGNFTATELQTLSPMAQTATAQDTAAAATPSPVYATTPYPTVQPEAEKSNTKWWILGGIAAAFGLAAISKKKNGRR